MRIVQKLHWIVAISAVALAPLAPARAELIATYGHENVSEPLRDDTGNGYSLVQNSSSVPVAFTSAPEQEGFYYFKLGETVAYYADRNSSRYLHVPDGVYPIDTTSGTGGDFTFVGLACPSSGSGWRTILSSDKFRFTFRIGQSGGTSIDSLHLGVWNEAGTGLSNDNSDVGTASPDTWYFVALRYDEADDTVTGFLQDASGTWDPLTVELSGASVPSSFNEMANLALGFNVTAVSGVSGSDPFAGMMDSIQFYTTALSDAELEDAFFQFAVPEPSSIVLFLLAASLTLLSRRKRRTQ